MNSGLSKNYAEALLSIGVDEGNYHDLQEEIKLLKDVILENKEFVSLLCSSFISFNEKEELIDKVLASFNYDIRSMIKILIKNRHGAELINVIEDFNSLVNKKRGILEGYVYSIYPLTNSQLEDISKKISDIEKVPCELKNIVDSTIIGGIKVAINGHVYDGSIQTKIEQMRASLTK